MSNPDGADMVPTEQKLQAMDSAPIGIVMSDPSRADNPLVYVNDAFEKLTGYSRDAIIGKNCRFLQGSATSSAARQTLREHIDAEEPVSVEIVNYRKDGERFWNEVTVAPIRDQAGNLTHFVGFQVGITKRKRAEREAKDHRQALEHLIERLHGLIQDVTEILMRSVTRPETENAICERIVKGDPYQLAAFGELDLTRNEIMLSSSAGTCSIEPDQSFDVDSDSPVTRPIDSQEVTVTSEQRVLEAFGLEDGAMAIAPLSFRSRDYGVLIVGSSDPQTFEDREPAVVEALGRTIAIAINAAESRRILVADNIVELEFLMTDGGLLVGELADRSGARLEYEASISLTQERIAACYTSDIAPNRLRTSLDHIEPDASLHPIAEENDRNLIAIESPNRSLQVATVERGGELRSLVATPDHVRIEIEALKAANPREIVEWLTDAYPETELVGFRERERPPRTKTDFISALTDKLTDRQRAAVEIAFQSGYYENQRTATGSQLAEVMGISRATFHQHLRAAERKIIGEFLSE